MNLSELIKNFNGNKVLLYPKIELDELLNSTEILSEKDSLVNGKIRILKFGNSIIFQEITGKDEIALRKFTKLKDAEKLVNNRLEVYENMWNGCGCKINYYN